MKRIEVYSTFATDRFVNPAGTILKESVGGPAYFITQVLSDLKIPHSVCSSPGVVVEILLTPEGEFGRIQTAPAQKTIKHLNNSILLVSTLLRDWKLIAGKSPIYLDVQGYVRDGDNFGQKQLWTFSSEIASALMCVKGTEEEISYLDPKFIINQKIKRQLIVTKGSAGADLYCNGKHYFIPTQQIIKSSDTVGAGDTWFAVFVAQQSRGFSPKDSAETATEYVRKFLTKKLA